MMTSIGLAVYGLTFFAFGVTLAIVLGVVGIRSAFRQQGRTLCKQLVDDCRLRCPYFSPEEDRKLWVAVAVLESGETAMRAMLKEPDAADMAFSAYTTSKPLFTSSTLVTIDGGPTQVFIIPRDTVSENEEEP